MKITTYINRCTAILYLLWTGFSFSQTKNISPELFGVFFEDINYAADGGLYAELIQNRSFEYSPSDIDHWHNESGWHSFTAWEFYTKGYGYGNISLESKNPVHKNNPHYVVINIESAGQEGIGLRNNGFDGIPIKKDETYRFSMLVKELSGSPFLVQIRLESADGKTVYGETTFSTDSKNWKKYTATISSNTTDPDARFLCIVKNKGKIALDDISLFPSKTFRNRKNGLRADLAQAIADLEPKFVRFPGGCVVHGDGLGNSYQWKNTVGPNEERKGQRNLWNYYQSGGLGYFEYFQFCEDINAKAIPILPAGVSCQNSGGTWRIEDDGQACLPLSEMDAYVQDILDLVEYANGDISTTWGAKRAEAGHTEPFNLEYIGIGNEEKITPEFEERFKIIYDAVTKKHPEITLIGTVGPGPKGDDYDKGWAFANELQVPIVDEHYYEKPNWFWENQNRYDAYDRNASKVYLGEYAAHEDDRKNTLRSALAEAAYMTALERNGDIVKMTSYAPLFAKKDHVFWSPNLIYFTNSEVLKSINYYVQQLFSVNAGTIYYADIISYDAAKVSKNTIATSVVKNKATKTIILKIVNGNATEAVTQINLSKIGTKFYKEASFTILTGDLLDVNTYENPEKIIPKTTELKISNSFAYNAPANSLSVIQLKLK